MSNYDACAALWCFAFSFLRIKLGTTGQPVSSSDGQGLTQSVTYGGVGGSMVPTQVTPNGNASLGSSMSWNGFLGLTSVASANGASQAFGYDAYGQPSSKTSPDGATTTLGYYPTLRYSVATVNGRFVLTHYEGLGRPIRTELRTSSTTISYTDTEYKHCACSPAGKVKRVSLPYAPGGTIRWTTYTYDGLGRTVSVAQPNGAGTTTYLYEGNTVKVTSPSGKWKKYEMNELGRMVQVTEPRPGGGTYLTNYTYNVTGKLVGVSMSRDGVTQTRTFTYHTLTQSRLLSATNPENGTVTYTYNPDGTTASKTDAKGVKTQFFYDPFKRVTQMRKSTLVDGEWTETPCQRVRYYYDEDGFANLGRLTRTSWNWMPDQYGYEVPCAVVGGFYESYSYNTAGRIVVKKLMLTPAANGGAGMVRLVANWTYNNEGQVTSITYPMHSLGGDGRRREVTHGFDSLARVNAVSSKMGSFWDPSPPWQSVISNVQFNAFGAVTSLNHLGLTETRQYNALGQMTRLTKGSLIDVEYRFSATANDGKILSQKNWLTGEDVVYAYDELERLISASTTAGVSWGLSWSYDGFGNRLSQNVTQGTGATSVTLVNANTNRISSSGYAYDANGNMTLMPKGSGSMTLNYDLSNRVESLSHPDGSEQYIYAPDNRRLWRSGQNALVFYSPGGQKMGVYNIDIPDESTYPVVRAMEENVYYGGRLVGKWLWAGDQASGAVGAFTADRLHSKGNGSQFYPYGESRTGSPGDDKEQFATYTRDEKSGLDYADQRWYASGVGRFTSVDPYGGSFRLVNPLSSNRYSYVEGDSVNRTDPTGLDSEGPPRFEWCSALDLIVPIDFCKFAANMGAVLNNLATQATVDAGRLREAEFVKQQKAIYELRAVCYKEAEDVYQTEMRRIGVGPDLKSTGFIIKTALITAISSAAAAIESGNKDAIIKGLAYGGIGAILNYALAERPEAIARWEKDTKQDYESYLSLVRSVEELNIKLVNNCNYAADRSLGILYRAFRP